jgi:purine-binding chemotaxis protein CheW
MSIEIQKIHQPMLDITTFMVGDAWCGIDILTVQEINKPTAVTPVPLAPAYVKGILNLRGQIITVLDVSTLLGQPFRIATKRQRNIIVQFDNESIALQVDSIGDVLRCRREDIEKTPANIAGIQGRYFAGVITTEKQLICMLNLDALLG